MKGAVSRVFEDFFKKNAEPLLKKGFRVLDFGCGDGKYYEFYTRLTPAENVFGAEISEKRVARCHKMGWKNVVKIEGLARIPWPDSFFDLINFDQVIEHMPERDILFYFKEFDRVLSDNGIIIVTTPNYPIKRVYDFLNAFRLNDLKRLKDDPTHITKYNFKKLKNIASQHFNVLSLEPTGGLFWSKLKHNSLSHKIVGILQKRCKQDSM